MRKQNIHLSITVLILILLLFSIHLLYRFDRSKHYSNFLNSQASLRISLLTLQDNKDLHNNKLIDKHVLFMEAALVSAIHYHTTMPELLSDFDRKELKKAIGLIEILVAEGKLDFLSRADLAEETKAFIEEGIEAIKSSQY